MLKNVISLLIISSSAAASATTLWTPSDNQGRGQSQPAPAPQNQEDGWDKFFGDLFGEVLNSPEVSGAVCDSLPREYQKLCSASIGDPKARAAAAEICGSDGFGSSRACFDLVASGNFSLPAVEFCKKAGMFVDDKVKCLRQVNNKSYDSGALEVCSKEISFDEEKLRCVRAIENKSYESMMLEGCRRQTFDDDVVACLRTTGL